MTGAGRPKPPEWAFASYLKPFTPAPEIIEWARRALIEGPGPLLNADHEHLKQAAIGALWTTEPNIRHMREVIGQAEIPGNGQGNKWSRARQRQQLVEWFGEEPDFVLTFSAHYALSCSDIEWCALVEHELYHCGQQLNEFGGPKFTKAGMPIFGMRGHDVEEFIGVVRRYGATSDQVRGLIEAGSKPPQISVGNINRVCGTCVGLK